LGRCFGQLKEEWKDGTLPVFDIQQKNNLTQSRNGAKKMRLVVRGFFASLRLCVSFVIVIWLCHNPKQTGCSRAGKNGRPIGDCGQSAFDIFEIQTRKAMRRRSGAFPTFSSMRTN